MTVTKEKELDDLLSGIVTNIRIRMENCRLNQTKLSKICKIDTSTISKLLLGRLKHAEWYTLYKIAAALDCTIDDFIGQSKTVPLEIAHFSDIKFSSDAAKEIAEDLRRVTRIIELDHIGGLESGGRRLVDICARIGELIKWCGEGFDHPTGFGNKIINSENKNG
jgi:DNA-binding Xre family transcriptional regulator